LIALMKDQVEALIKDRKFEKVAYLNSELSLIEREEILQDCHTGKIDILYLSPELLLSYDISFFIGERKLGLLVIDEAHLITTWGRDFRVDYWFIGNHIRKIRKYSGNSFPMVAVTATAIYGGSNDMVFDCIESLAMNDRHAFIGLVKRNDINFFVNNYQQFNQNYQKNKVKQTADFIAQIEKNTNFKTLVYVPYSSHVNKITEELTSRGLEISTGYFGRLDSDLKVKAFDEFKSGEKQIMVSTKAFGMGVDISDIQVVYHHAPSGLLPDYIQEVGRLARREDLTGYAALNYTEQDKSYSKALYGMSAIRPQQLSEVLKKIVSIYKNQKRKNLLISTDDFAHIFEDSDSIDQKVLTSLMMIEKDYIEKTRFNVLIARPKKLFVKVFARIKTSDRDFLLQKFSTEIEEVSYKYLEERGFNIISIDLDKIWTKYFPQQSFPKLKSDFYKEKLFTFFNKNLEVTPLLNINYDLNFEFNDAYTKFDNILQIIGTSFFNLSNHFFKEDDLYNELNNKLNNIDFSRKLTKFLLSNYSGRFTAMNRIEPNVFLQKKLNIDEYSYRLINNLHSREFSDLRTKFSRIFQNEDKLYKRFVTNKDSISISYIRLGYFLDILDLGTFEIKGGESPMIFLRLNDPKRIEKDSKGYYKNILLEKTMQRHNLSNKIFDHFFMNTFTNNERWNFIEDFFLGKEIDDLIEEYPGNGPISELNIIEKLKEKFTEQNNGRSLENENDKLDLNQTIKQTRLYYADQSKTYYDDVLLTIDIDGVPTTKKVDKWLVENVVEFDKIRKEKNLNIPSKVFEIMVSKLRQNKDYFKENLSINHMIDYPGFNVKVKAIVAFNNDPIKFYKWYLANPGSLILNFKDKIKVFSKVYELDKKALKQEHLNLIKK
jgi:ATP-dependent DNA helicase RecQ